MSMLCFSLGTVPLMLGFGSAVSMLGKRFTRQVLKAGAILVVVMGLSMMVQGGTLSGLNSKVTGTLMVENTDVDKKNTDETQYITSTLQSGRSYPTLRSRQASL